MKKPPTPGKPAKKGPARSPEKTAPRKAPAKAPAKGQDKAHDAALWHKVARTVTPYKGKMTIDKSGLAPAKKAVPPAIVAGKISAESAQKSTTHKQPPAAAPPVRKDTGGFDRATATKLKKGQLPIDGSLDLHGMTQAQALQALHRFVAAAVRQEKRTLLIITGKGRLSEQGGVLRRMLPLWLEDAGLAKHVIALTPAAAKDGGSGAFYLRLRKKRPD